jgi:hypothetical protein
VFHAKSATMEQLRGLAAEGSLYALLDACDEPAVPEHCEAMTAQRAISLYRGKAQEEYWHIAPYLAHLAAADLEWIAEKLWRLPWGYFVVANSDLDTLRTHFRRFLTVKLHDGSEVLFRFYDPRVLKTFLESSQPHEVHEFYGPARAFAVNSPDQKETVAVWFP